MSRTDVPSNMTIGRKFVAMKRHVVTRRYEIWGTNNIYLYLMGAHDFFGETDSIEDAKNITKRYRADNTVAYIVDTEIGKRIFP